MAFRLFALTHQVTGKEEKTRHDQGAADEHHVVAQPLHRAAHRQHRKEGQRGNDDQHDHPPGRGHGRRGTAPGQIADAAEELSDHIQNVLPIGHKYRQQRTQMQQHVVELRNLRLQVQKVLGNGQMTGAGNGQKLSNSLHKAQQNRTQICHRVVPPVDFDYNR